jgi:zinc transport system substrate-binding protein
MKRFIFLFILAGLLFSVVLAVFSTKRNVSDSKQIGKLSVVTTLFPLYDFAREVGGDAVSVSLLLLPGAESHAFEPTPNDVVKIHTADVFIYTGKFMEPWAEDIIKGVTNKNVKVVDSSLGIEMMNEAEGAHESGKEEAHADDQGAEAEDIGHKHGGVDPHIWLDFDNARTMVETIARAFAEKDPANTERYRENAKVYAEKLSAMDDLYRKSLQSCSSRKIVYGGHYAFGYLARQYGLEYVAAQGLSPDAEPSAQDLAQLVEQVRNGDIKYVFYEELTNPKIAETIANETEAKLLLLNAAHNISKEGYTSGVTFLSLMEENRKNLAKGLGCQNNFQ